MLTTKRYTLRGDLLERHPRVNAIFPPRGFTVRRLEIQNLAIIQQLELTLGDGFNVFTGETGAGKSIIVDAIWLLTGSRADAELVRTGEESLLVTGFWEGLTLARRVANAPSPSRWRVRSTRGC